MSDQKSNMEKIADIVRAINGYSPEEISNELANIQTRVENVIIYNRIDKDEQIAKKDPNSYKIKVVETLHAKATIEYTELYSAEGSEYQTKASLFGRLYAMDQQLRELERGIKKDED
ncbi:hypothetical protein [Bacillus sp. T33-2]|uniref:hypothetical protein n=1 Tax=Bacillus sp. T33-2 TaxID=2054168 RepID=UPI000C77FAEE|nr:hypothetical protein [Bacillus sp. T33-2]PLR93174.1 hypothetical protein CVD19_19395 [Bacillus sp. T33-2]